MRILFIHPNFPAQFVNLARVMAQNPQHQVVFLTNRREGSLPGVTKVYYDSVRKPHPQTHHYLRSTEDAVLQAQAASRAALSLKNQGFIPDVIYGHSGWGPTMYMKDIFPSATLLCYFEWFYNAHGSDCSFDPTETLSLDDECRIRTRNAPILIDLFSCDQGVSPTHYQHSQFPKEWQKKITVLHDGVDTNYYQPQLNKKLVLPDLHLDLSDVDEIITYVGRGMEPYRGFPQFMEMVEILLKRRPQCHFVIVGNDRVAYGKPSPDGRSYKEIMLEKFDIDLLRVHFTGLLPHSAYRQVLAASSAHVYLTRPFVLSWSMLEAMSMGCLLVASNTEPVREVIQDGVNGLLFDFFSPEQMADQIEMALDNKQEMAKIRKAARETILERYDLKHLLAQQLTLLENATRRHR